MTTYRQLPRLILLAMLTTGALAACNKRPVDQPPSPTVAPEPATPATPAPTPDTTPPAGTTPTNPNNNPNNPNNPTTPPASTPAPTSRQ